MDCSIHTFYFYPLLHYHMKVHIRSVFTVETSFFLGDAQSWRWTTAAVAFSGTNFSSGSTASCLSGRLAPPLRHPRGPFVEILSLEWIQQVRSYFEGSWAGEFDVLDG